MAGSVIGAGLGLVGSMMQSRSADKASARAAEAARFDPWNTYGGLFGGASFNEQTGAARFDPSGLSRSLEGAISPQLLQLLSGGGAGTQFGNLLTSTAGEDMPGAYAGAQNFGMVDPSFLQQFTNQSQLGSGALFGAGLQGLMGQPGAFEQMQLGRDFLGSQAQSYDQVAADRLGLLREQAAPFEERATDSLMGRLFGQGRMGSTGGGRDIEAFARGLGQADTSRQLEAQTFAEQLYGRDLSAALQRQGIGANLFSGGLQSLMQGQQMGAGFLGGAMDATGNVLNAQTAFNQLGYSRAQDRLQRTQDLFGFGSALQSEDLSRATNMYNILGSLSAEQRAQLGLGADMGKAQAAAGANAGNFMVQGGGSPLGGFLGGLGQGVMTGSIPLPWGGGSADNQFLLGQMAAGGMAPVTG